MSCRRKGGTASSGPVASDVDDRELSKAAQLRVEKKSQQPPAAAAGGRLPLAPFAFVLVCLFVALYLTIKYSG